MRAKSTADVDELSDSIGVALEVVAVVLDLLSRIVVQETQREKDRPRGRGGAEGENRGLQ